MFALMLLSATATATTPVPPAPLSKSCERQMRIAEKAKGPIRPRKLGDLPPANQILTVYREVDGCPKPVVVRRDIGK